MKKFKIIIISVVAVNGTERYIDFNVFNGTKEDFAGYPLH